MLSLAERKGLWHRQLGKGRVMSCGAQSCALLQGATISCMLPDVATCFHSTEEVKYSSAEETLVAHKTECVSHHGAPLMPSQPLAPVCWLPGGPPGPHLMPSRADLMCCWAVQVEDQKQLIASQREVHTSLQQHLSQLQMQLADEQASSALSTEQVGCLGCLCGRLPQMQMAPACPLPSSCGS